MLLHVYLLFLYSFLFRTGEFTCLIIIRILTNIYYNNIHILCVCLCVCVCICACLVWDLGNRRSHYCTSFASMKSFVWDLHKLHNKWRKCAMQQRMMLEPSWSLSVETTSLMSQLHMYIMFNRVWKCSLSHCPPCKSGCWRNSVVVPLYNCCDSFTSIKRFICGVNQPVHERLYN